MLLLQRLRSFQNRHGKPSKELCSFRPSRFLNFFSILKPAFFEVMFHARIKKNALVGNQKIGVCVAYLYISILVYGQKYLHYQ
jgi:hypothetical protein